MALLPEPLLDHVRSQFGLVNRAQALETLSQDALRSRLRSGLLVPASIAFTGSHRRGASERLLLA